MSRGYVLVALLSLGNVQKEAWGVADGVVR
jgi:hypothetical protein